MCGIAGIVGQADVRLLGLMAEAIAHRGPDGAGLWKDEIADVGLVHRRLSIIDLSDAAAQPMAAVDERYQVVFNGEIYNYKELQASLQRRGYRFNPNSDTAVLGPLYDLFGVDMLHKLNGIFAFAIWDSRLRTLFAARDRVGAKPFYYVQRQGRFAFASEIKALSEIPDLDRSIDEGAIYDYLEKLWCPGEGTPFRSVRKLPAGHAMLVKDGRIEIAAWAEVALPISEIPKEPVLAKAALLDLLDEAVSTQCVSDVPIGAFLSGGVDSTAVVASMVKTGNRPHRAYCIGFEGTGMKDEGFGEDQRYAKLAADALGVKLTYMQMRVPGADDFSRLAWMLDEPQADPAPLFLEAISARAQVDGIKVLLSGTGGDDIFGGYRRHVAASIRNSVGPLRSMIRFVPNPGKSGTIGRRLARLKGLMAGDSNSFLSRSFEFNSRPLARACLSDKALQAAAADSNLYWEEALAERQGGTIAARVIQLERRGFLPDHNLNYTDKASMARGVEVRVPLLDPRLIAFADALPIRWKVRGLDAKWLLKRALEARAPKAITRRSKTGFGGPVRSWINGPLAPTLKDMIASTSFRTRGLFDVAGVQRVLSATEAGTEDGSYLLLAVMMIEFWLQRFASAPRHGSE